MSILIPGMKMPTRCWDCPCAYFTEGVHHNYCQAVGYDTEITDDGKPDWCPLIELPPHGRLGDLDVLADHVDFMMAQHVHVDAFELVQNAPTIIPAEGGANDG